MSERIIIAVKEGKVRGVKRRSEYSGAEFYSFFGVPYGQSPINALRFKVCKVIYKRNFFLHFCRLLRM